MSGGVSEGLKGRFCLAEQGSSGKRAAGWVMEMGIGGRGAVSCSLHG